MVIAQFVWFNEINKYLHFAHNFSGLVVHNTGSDGYRYQYQGDGVIENYVSPPVKIARLDQKRFTLIFIAVVEKAKTARSKKFRGI
jgi:hypothetical protein